MTSTPQDRPPYLWAFVTSVLIFLIYLATLAPTTAFWDTSEYIAAARVLGIPHPPGNPALHHHGSHLRFAPAGGILRGEDQSLRGLHQRRRRGILVPGRGTVAPGNRHLPVGPLRGGVRRRPRGCHVVERVEPVHGQRKGVHGLAPLDRAGHVAGRAMGRRRPGQPPRPLACAHRVRPGAELHQPPDGAAGGPGAGGLRALDRLARAHAPAGPHRHRHRGARRHLAQLPLPPHSGGPVSGDQRG